MPLSRRRFVVTGACLAAAPLAARARDWPEKPVKLIIPSAPGSSPDRLTRLIAERLSARWGQNVLVENRPGGATRIGTLEVARAAPDGYVLLSTFSSHPMVRLLDPNTPYDPVADFVTITQYAAPEVVMLVRSEMPYRSLADLVAAHKASGQPMRYGHFGSGSGFHLYGLMVGKKTGIEVVPVAYKGEALHLNDLLGGHLDVSFNSIGTALPHLRSGRIRALGLVSARRSKVLPEVPTFAELGYEDMESGGWFGFLAPKGTPAALVDKVYQDITAIVADPAMVKTMRDQGIEPMASTPAEFGRVLPADVNRAARLFAQFGIKPD